MITRDMSMCQAVLENHLLLPLFPLGAVVEYLTSTHTYYLEIALPRVEGKIHRLLNSSALSTREVTLVSDFFNDYKKEFLAHIS